MKVVLIHGKDATPQDKWYPWFGEQVEKIGHEYIAPKLPNPSAPIFEEWSDGLNSCNPDENTVLIGHSRGGATVLRWLEMQPDGVRVKKVILVAANSGRIEANLPPNESKKGFYDDVGYNFEKIKSHCDDFVVFHSTDDKWVPYSSGEENTAGLEARFMSYTDKGHFGKALGEFPELVKEIEDIENKHQELLDVIDEQENIIDQVPRDEVHNKGLLHREVHVWLHDSDGQIIFQKRSDTKETFPSLLDASAGGHIDIGETPEIAAVKELQEECGLTISTSQLNFIDKTRSKSTDPQTGKINNTIRYVYSYLFTGQLSDLTLEEGKGDGFVAYSVLELENLSQDQKEKFIPKMISKENMAMYKNITTPQFGEYMKDAPSRPGVYAVVIQDNKVLALKVKNRLHLPGGGVDVGEDNVTALKREIVEETGYQTKDLVFIGRANQYTHHTKLGAMNKLGSFYMADVNTENELESEIDHEVVWVDIDNYKSEAFEDWQKWAIQKALVLKTN